MQLGYGLAKASQVRGVKMFENELEIIAEVGIFDLRVCVLMLEGMENEVQVITRLPLVKAPEKAFQVQKQASLILGRDTLGDGHRGSKGSLHVFNEISNCLNQPTQEGIPYALINVN